MQTPSAKQAWGAEVGWLTDQFGSTSIDVYAAQEPVTGLSQLMSALLFGVTRKVRPSLPVR